MSRLLIWPGTSYSLNSNRVSAFQGIGRYNSIVTSSCCFCYSWCHVCCAALALAFSRLACSSNALFDIERRRKRMPRQPVNCLWRIINRNCSFRISHILIGFVNQHLVRLSICVSLSVQTTFCWSKNIFDTRGYLQQAVSLYVIGK